ncbi:MAG: binding-protein-dependent transport permease [Clostridia bacterium]|nr:binding-protein-dependent transport permease [Clostridia bacterium]
MGKAILAAIVTLIAGCLGMVAGLELLDGFVEFGCIIAIAVMGAFIIYFNEKKK